MEYLSVSKVVRCFEGISRAPESLVSADYRSGIDFEVILWNTARSSPQPKCIHVQHGPWHLPLCRFLLGDELLDPVACTSCSGDAEKGRECQICATALVCWCPVSHRVRWSSLGWFLAAPDLGITQSPMVVTWGALNAVTGSPMPPNGSMAACPPCGHNADLATLGWWLPHHP